MRLYNCILFLFLFAFKANSLFGQNTVGLLEYSSLSNEGYTLFSPSNSNTSYLIDNCGFKVHSWTSIYKPGLMAYLQEDGTLLRTARIPNNFLAGGSAGRVEIFDWDNELLWAYNFSDETQHSHHDIAPMPNGNFLVLLWDSHTEEELIEMGRDSNFIPMSKQIWSEKIQEIKPIGNDEIEVVWEWNSWDHIIQDFDPTKSNFGMVDENPNRYNINYPIASMSSDWMHMNSIDYNPELDQISINSRNFDEFYIIDHSTSTEEARTNTGGKYGKGGDILYRWGNPQAYNKGDASDKKLFGQHDASWIDKGLQGEGNILVFNNGSGRPANEQGSDVEEIQLKENNDGFYQLDEEGKFGPDEYKWIYPKELNSNFYSRRISGAQRLENGNTLICDGQLGILFEVNETDSIVWAFLNPVSFNGPIVQGDPPSGSDIFKVRRYSYDFPAFEGRDLHPIAPIELQPNPTDCLTTSINNINLEKSINLFPNPFLDEINVELPVDKQFKVEIFNQVGQRVSCDLVSGSSTISITKESKGIYLVKITSPNNTVIEMHKMIKL